MRRTRVGVREIVALGAIFGLKLIEIVVGQQGTIGLLPGANMNARNGEGVGGFSRAKLHEQSIARQYRSSA